MGLSTRNAEKVVVLVLKKLAVIECDPLPKLSFSKYILIEARRLAQLQIGSKLAACEEDLVLKSMEQAKKGHSFIPFNASKSAGQFHVLSLYEVVSGYPQAQMVLLKEVVGDVSEFTKIIYV